MSFIWSLAGPLPMLKHTALLLKHIFYFAKVCPLPPFNPYQRFCLCSFTDTSNAAYAANVIKLYVNLN